MNRWNLAWLISIPSIVVAGLVFAYNAPVSRERQQDYELIRLFADVLTEVDQNYVRELDPKARRQLVEDMIEGGLERLDPHTTYFNERELQQFRIKSKGKFGGVGISVLRDQGTKGLLVTSPIAGTPAYEAGIQPGDLITKVDGVSLEGKRSTDAIDLIMGEPGTPVTLTVLHEGETEPTDMPLKRATIEVPTVVGDMRKPDEPKEWDYMIDKDKKIAYIRVLEFGETTAADLRKALQALQTQGVTGLVLDLRANPGGLLKSAVEVSDMFLSEGAIVSTRRRRSDDDETFNAKPDNNLLEPAADHPIVVLIDRFSASASEIVAAALQDHKRATIIGERSYGKGSVQNLHAMEDRKTAIKITIASYWRPSGKNIHRFPDAKETDDWGVRPNEGFDVRLTDQERKDYFAGRRYRDIVSGKTGHMPDKVREKVEAPFHDKVLDRAMQHIREQLAVKATAAG
jgi:carboxyl-terminal processing protease